MSCKNFAEHLVNWLSVLRSSHKNRQTALIKRPNKWGFLLKMSAKHNLPGLVSRTVKGLIT